MPYTYCPKCNTWMKNKQSGHSVGSVDSEGTVYMVMRGDLYECPKCHVQVITGFGTGIDRPDMVGDILENTNPERMHVEVK